MTISADRNNGADRLRLSVLVRRPVHLLAFGLGAGLVPKAPGTAGTLVAVPIAMFAAPLDPLGYHLMLAGLFIAGVWICDRTGRDLQVHDHPGIVWDEIVGYLVAVAWIPRAAAWLIAGFVLFRLFDILKPWPIRIIDRRVSGGLGVMLDDLLAGLAAGVILGLTARF